MVALWNRADHYIFILWFLSSSSSVFFSLPNLSRRRLDVYHTSTHGVALLWSPYGIYFRPVVSLWPPYGIGQAIIFSSRCYFFLLLLYFSSPNLSGRRLDVYHTSTHGVALLWPPYVIGGHYIFALWFLSSIYLSFFSSPNLSGHRLDLYHTSTHGVALVRI